MKELIIKSMRFVNFKGLRDLKISFPAKNIDISADNGLGKSSIFDGFTWVLFGKDRKGRKKFGIKTYDKNNVIIPKIPHEVELVLEVREDNQKPQEVRLTRKFNEKWVKKRGSAVEEFQGNEGELLYNDVPCSVDEWEQKISELCSETIFMFITNPLYFTSQKPEVQREMLFRMVGGINDTEVAAGNKKFAELLETMTGKSMDDFKKEVSAKKSRIKKELKDLPGMIEERQRDIEEPEDWAALEAERQTLNDKRYGLLKQLGSIKDAYNAESDKIKEQTAKINALKKQYHDREFEVQMEVNKDFRKQQSERAALMDEYNECRRKLGNIYEQTEQEEAAINQCTEKRTQLVDKINGLFKETEILKTQSNKVPELNENELKCPTCGHNYDYEVIEQIQKNAAEQHRAKYASLLADNARQIAAVREQGVKNNEVKEKHIAKRAELEATSKQLENRKNEIEDMPLFIAAPEAPDCEPALQSDSILKDLKNQIDEAEKALDNSVAPDYGNQQEIENEINDIAGKIEQIAVRLAKRQKIEKDKERLSILENELKTNNAALAELEGLEFTMQEFSKARIETVENKINSLFTIVKFKMFDRQINGGETETCEAMIDGVPFADLNDAGKINAGLDIINAICKFEDTYAPIFIDNSESINRPLPTVSQRIRLTVSQDNEIKVSASDTTPNLFNI